MVIVRKKFPTFYTLVNYNFIGNTMVDFTKNTEFTYYTDPFSTLLALNNTNIRRKYNCQRF